MEKFYCTIYTNQGQRIVVSGNDQEDVLQKHYGEGFSTLAVQDKWEPGITDDYVFTSGKEWVEKTFVDITPDDVEEGLIISPSIMSSKGIVVTFPNKDQLTICKQIGNYATLGWVESIYIYYSEFNQGNYGDEPGEEDEDSCHYMVTGSQHFPVTEIVEAEKVFIERVLSPTPWKTVSNTACLTLDEIAVTHPIEIL